MALRILHTSDWHLGHRLHDRERGWEHARFLEWLLVTLEEECVDAMIVAGDVFDIAHPSADTARVWYRFLADLAVRLPKLDLVVVAGNHDSATRIEAPKRLIEGLGPLHVVGSLPRKEAGEIDLDACIVPLHDSDGQAVAWCAALPYLRPADLPSAADLRDRMEREEVNTLLDGARVIYADALAALKSKRTEGQALIATGHLFLTGASLSEDSERLIQRGNQESLPADIFGPELSYVALGHLHKAQKVDGQERLRYCGSPIPLSLAERMYKHQVLVVDFDGEEIAELRELPVPRRVNLLRVPTQGTAAPDDLLAALADLEDQPESGTPPLEERPFLELRVLLEEPRPSLRREVQEALENKLAVLASLKVESPNKKSRSNAPQRELQELKPADILKLMWSAEYEGEPTAELMAAYAELVEEAQSQERQA